MKDYVLTYQVTVATTANNIKEAKETALALLESADSGWADTAVSVNKLIKKGN